VGTPSWAAQYSAESGVTLREQWRHRHGGVLSAYYDDAGIGHVPSARAVCIEVVADQHAFRKTYVLIQDRAAHLGMAADVAVIHDDGTFYQGAGVHADTSAENRCS